VDTNVDRLPISPYFLFKDRVTFAAIGFLLIFLVAFTPNALGHRDNYIEANPLVTPSRIVPEWYLLPFYAILRRIPNKLLGVLAMLFALLILLILPITDTGRTRGARFRPAIRLVFWGFVSVFFILLYIGACHVARPWIELGQITTILYFGFFVFFVPIAGIVDNTLADLRTTADLEE
jgi:quinol-cytochrome oxidoreductase complex cytochrome b subunit